MSPFSATVTSISYDTNITESTTGSSEVIGNDTVAKLKIESSDDEISVGCPSPVPIKDSDSKDEYFRPLKRLKMDQDRASASSNLLDDKRLSPNEASASSSTSSSMAAAAAAAADKIGVKSFSIMEILNHRPKPAPSSLSAAIGSTTKIVRPWDNVDDEYQKQLKNDASSAASWTLAHQMAFFRRAEIAAATAATAAFNSSTYTSETGSDRSSSVTSECCSPDNNNSIHFQQSKQKVTSSSRGNKGGSDPSTPLDALFQMTSKTFDSNSADTNSDGQNPNMFSSRQQPKKKRKSRTAFTNHQIFELEKRFLYQKYLSPADRDEIAASLGLSNAQVITWFQNRRAKLKRDMEELKKDVESAKILTAHKTFLENVQDLNSLKKKALLSVSECSKNLLLTSDK